MNSQLFLPLLIVLLAVPLFLQVRKQKKAMQEQQKLQNSLTAGDRVMTTSGLFGTIVSTGDTTVDLEIAPGVVTTWLNQAIREKVDTEDAAQDESAEAADEQAEVAEEPAAEKTEKVEKAEDTSAETKAEDTSAEQSEKQKTS